MILHRFCSQREFAAYMRGETLENHTDHYRGGLGGSTSRGGCFFRGDVYEWARRLNGLVEFDVLITVNTHPSLVSVSMGVYADWAKDDGTHMPPKKHFREYCTDHYDRDNFHLMKVDHSFSENHVSRSKIQSFLESSGII